MLRIHFLQHCDLSDPAIEEALHGPVYESLHPHRFGKEPVPDEITACKFRHLLENHELGRQIFQSVGAHLQKGLHLSRDAFIGDGGHGQSPAKRLRPVVLFCP